MNPFLVVGVGKTSIVLQLVDNYFSRSFKPSKGIFRVDYKLYRFLFTVIRRSVGEDAIILNVNDFPGMLIGFRIICRKS